MNNQEYEQKKRECFVQFCKDNGINQEVNISIFDAFNQIFDRAYALDKNNLTSDAEEEEMLTCEKSRIQQQYKRASQLKDDSDPKWEFVGDQIERVLIGLFGSKCLPDELNEDNFAKSNTNEDNFMSKEPKPAEPTDKNPKENANTFALTQGAGPVRLENDHLQVRLQVAAMAMQGLLANPALMEEELNFWYDEDKVARCALAYADALIAQCEEKGDDK